MKRYMLFFVFISVSLGSSGQSVDELISMAYAHNPGLESLKLSYQAALERSNQMSDYPDPTVSLGIGVLPVNTRLGTQLFRIGVTQPIPWKGLLNSRKELALTKAQILASVDEVREIDIEYTIRTSYSQLLFLEDRLQIIKQKLELLDILEELAKSSVRSGQGKLSNILLIQRTREGLESDLRLFQKQKEGPTITINRWTGREINQEITVIPTTPKINAPDTLDFFAETLHPAFDIIEQKITTSKKQAELTQLEKKPRIGVGLEYGWIKGRTDVMNLPGNGRDILMPMGSISIPLHTDRFKSVQQEEKINQEALLAQKEDLQEAYRSEIATAISTIEFRKMEIEKMEGLKEITRETLDLMRSEYASEGTRFEELLRLELELIDYDLMIAQAKFQQQIATATLLKFQ